MRRVVLLGSRARGTNFPKSDIDLAYSGGDGFGFEDDLRERLWPLHQVDIIRLDEPISSDLQQQNRRARSLKPLNAILISLTRQFGSTCCAIEITRHTIMMLMRRVGLPTWS